MSQATLTDIVCGDCGERPTLRRGYARTLQVACDCDRRDIKVKRLLPEWWDE